MMHDNLPFQLHNTHTHTFQKKKKNLLFVLGGGEGGMISHVLGGVGGGERHHTHLVSFRFKEWQHICIYVYIYSIYSTTVGTIIQDRADVM